MLSKDILNKIGLTQEQVEELQDETAIGENTIGKILSIAIERKMVAKIEKSDCPHNNTEHQTLRCNVCHDCGEVVETDV